MSATVVICCGERYDRARWTPLARSYPVLEWSSGAPALLAHLDDLTIDRVHVIGEGAGRSVALELTSARVDRVLSLTLVDASAVERARCVDLRLTPLLLLGPRGDGPIPAHARIVRLPATSRRDRSAVGEAVLHFLATLRRRETDITTRGVHS